MYRLHEPRCTEHCRFVLRHICCIQLSRDKIELPPWHGLAELIKAVSSFNLYRRSMINLLVNCGSQGCLHKGALKGRWGKKKIVMCSFTLLGDGEGEGSFTLVIWDTPHAKFLSPQAKWQSRARTPGEYFQLTSICRMSQTSLMNKMINVCQWLHKVNEFSLQRAYIMHSSAWGTC